MAKRILIVDDEPNNLQLLRHILKDDYALSFAKNGKEALSAVSKHAIDLILLDVMMPEMDGYETCLRLKQNPDTKDIPVIFVTAMNDTKDEARGFAVGGVDYLTKPVSTPIVKARVKIHLSLVKIDELEQSRKEAVYMLGDAGHYNDDDTGVHIWRMAAYARAIAEKIGYSKSKCDLIELAAPMHDTGKIGVPDEILKKKGKLDSDEWVTMKTHTRIGYEILSNSDAPLFKLAAEISLRHHEKWDGSGYPDGLKGEEIPEVARIVAIADVFDALTMKRPYKEAWPVEEAVEEITKLSGQHFDPNLVNVFLSILPEIIAIRNKWNQQESI